jgi:hypothetical protein
VVVSIPRDSRSSIPEREAVLHVRYAPFTIKKPYNPAPVKTAAEWIEVMILNMTYTARLTPEAPCSVLLGEEEWKLPYRVANKEKQEVKEPYSMKEAVNYLGWLGGPKRSPSDGPPGVKTIWIGLMKLYILLAYREYLA